jgi:DNA-binding NarL/FixJ family response regulator
MDISMPDMNGMDLCRIVKDKYPSVMILGLSTFNEQSYIRKMIDQGASGYILKNAGKQELLDAIHSVAKGKIFLSDEVAFALNAKASSNIPVITRREKEILGLIADGSTNAEIAAKLFISAFTVETHRKNLLTKFEVKNTASLIRKAAASGLI